MNKKQKISKIASVTMILLVASFVFSNVALASEINPGTVIKLVNDARDSQGLAMLNENTTLDKIATDKLNDMIANNYFAHTSPKGVSPWSWYEKENYDYKYAGENLAINFVTAEDQQKAWMDSPTHRKNILNSDYMEIGVAVGAGSINGQTSIIAVQEFGSRIGETQTLNDQKNFSGQGKSGLMKDGQKMTPAVLSAKDANPGDGNGNTPAGDASQNSFLKTLSDAFSRNGYGMSQALMIINLMLLTLVFVLSPAVFIVMAYSYVISPKNKNSIAVKFMDNFNKKRLIKIHMS